MCARLSDTDRHVVGLIKQTMRDAGLSSDLLDAERVAVYSDHGLRASLASNAEIDERYLQKHLGNASAVGKK